MSTKIMVFIQKYPPSQAKGIRFILGINNLGVFYLRLQGMYWTAYSNTKNV